MSYIRHDANNNVVTAIASYARHDKDGNPVALSKYVRHDENCNAMGARDEFQRHDSSNTLDSPQPESRTFVDDFGNIYRNYNADYEARDKDNNLLNDYESVFNRTVLDLNFAGNKSLIDAVSGNNLITFSRASTATYVGTDGLIKTAAVDEARFDHDFTTGESLGLLIEESRTNLLLKSEKLNEWIIGGGSSVTANQAVAPDGTTTADRVQHGSVGSSYLQQQNITTPGVTYTISVYAKAVTPGTNDQFTFQLGLTSNVFTATGEWQRFTFTDTAFGTSIYLNNGGDSFATDVYFWGAQVEEGDFATSYIPTVNSSATRDIDYAQITGTNFSSFFNPDASTVFVEGNITAGSLGQYALFAIKKSNSNGAFNISRRSASGSRFNRFDPSGSQDIDINGPTWTDNSFRKLACAMGQTSAGFADSGSLIGTTTTYVKPAASDGLTKLVLGSADRGGFSPYNVHIKRLAYFNTRLSDTILQTITA